jgi:hypothetical protein
MPATVHDEWSSVDPFLWRLPGACGLASWFGFADMEPGDLLGGGAGDFYDQVTVVVEAPGSVGGFDSERVGGQVQSLSFDTALWCSWHRGGPTRDDARTPARWGGAKAPDGTARLLWPAPGRRPV